MTQKTNEITSSNQDVVPVFQELDKRDENQILSEISGEILEELVYEITVFDKETQRNRKVTNLSYAGVKEAIRHRQNVEIIGEPKIEETETTIRALIKVRDLTNHIDVLGASEADKNKAFAYVLAVNKAERNAFAKLLPVKVITETINRYREQKNGNKEVPTPIIKPQLKPTPKPVNPPVKLDPETLTIITTTAQMQKQGLTQYPITEGLTPLGMINVFGDFICIVPENTNLRRDNPAFTNFLFPRILDRICNKYQCQYDDVGTENGELLYILIKGKLAEEEIKGLISGAKWSFSKASGTNGGSQPPS